MRKRLKQRLFEQFPEALEKRYPGFVPTEDSVSERAFVLKHSSGWNYFMFLDTVDGRDCFDVSLGVATKTVFPYTVPSLPTSPLENGARRFDASHLRQNGGVLVYWCIDPEPEDPLDLDQWLKPPTPIDELLPRIEEVVEECLSFFMPAFVEYIDATSKEPLPPV